MRPPANIDSLLDRAAAGDAEAADQALLQHRDRLRQMVAVRLDPLLSARVDPSDVVQEALVEASRKLSDYLERRPLPFYAWLRQIAWERLVHLHRRHVQTLKRTVHAEEEALADLSEHSMAQLADRLSARGSSPSKQLIRQELRARIQAGLQEMAPPDREILIMWYLEQLSVPEMAAVLEMSESGVKSRHRRALERLTALLTSSQTEE